jgi:hypothetical protein
MIMGSSPQNAAGFSTHDHGRWQRRELARMLLALAGGL